MASRVNPSSWKKRPYNEVGLLWLVYHFDDRIGKSEQQVAVVNRIDD